MAFKNIFLKRNPRGKELEDGSSSRTFNIFVYPVPFITFCLILYSGASSAFSKSIWAFILTLITGIPFIAFFVYLTSILFILLPSLLFGELLDKLFPKNGKNEHIAQLFVAYCIYAPTVFFMLPISNDLPNADHSINETLEMDEKTKKNNNAFDLIIAEYGDELVEYFIERRIEEYEVLEGLRDPFEKTNKNNNIFELLIEQYSDELEEYLRERQEEEYELYEEYRDSYELKY